MNKNRVNRNSTSNGVTNTNVKNEKESIKNEAQKTKQTIETDLGSEDVTQKTTKEGSHNKGAAGSRKSYSPKHKSQINHNFGPNRSSNYVNRMYNGSKISTGTMTIPQMMIFPPNLGPKSGEGGHYQYNFEFLHEVGMQMANVSHRQGLNTSIYRNSSVSAIGDLHLSSSVNNTSSNGSNSYHMSNYNSYDAYNDYNSNYNQNHNYQQRNSYNSNVNQNNNNFRNNHKYWNWNHNPNYRQNNRNNNKISNNAQNAPYLTNTSNPRNNTLPSNLVYVNTNMRHYNRANNRPPTPNIQQRSIPIQIKSPETSSKAVDILRSSVNSSPDHHSIGPDSDSDSGTSSSLNASKTSVTSQRSRHSNHSNQSVNMEKEVGGTPFNNIAGFPHLSPVEIVSNVPYHHDHHRPNGGTLANNSGQLYVGHPSPHVGPWITDAFPSVYGNASGVHGFANDSVIECVSPNGFYIENNNTQPVDCTNKRSLEKARNKQENCVKKVGEINNQQLSPPNIHRQRHPFSHIMRVSPLPQGTNPAHSLYPQDRFLLKTHNLFLAEPPDSLCNGSQYDRMSQEIWKKFIACRQTEEMYKNKVLLWKDLFIAINGTFARLGLYMVGSTITGFGTDTSDVDMCIVDKAVSSADPRAESMWVLTRIKECIQDKYNYENFQLIQARVPILRFKHVDHKVEVDLNFNNIVGIRNTHLLHAYAQMDWRLRPLILIVKLWAQHHNINDARNATISSYSFVLMVIHFLQCGVEPAVLPCLQKKYPEKFHPQRDVSFIDMHEDLEPYKSKNQQSLGELFVQFLGYYSNFNYSEHAISIRTASVLPIEQCRHAQSSKNDIHQWKVLCIEEPFDLSNTARSVYDAEVFERIKATIHTSWRLLQENNNLDVVFNTPFFTPINHHLKSGTHEPLSVYINGFVHNPPDEFGPPTYHYAPQQVH